MTLGRPGLFFEINDLSQFVQGVESSIMAIAGNAYWGEVNTLTTIGSFDEFVAMFGKPKSPTVTPMHYQVLGFFAQGGKAVVVRSQGTGCLHGGAEALKTTAPEAMAAGIASITAVPSGSNVVGFYTRYPGVHDDGGIYIEIYDVDDAAGTFTVKVGTEVATNLLVTTHKNYEEHVVSVISTAKDGYGRSAFIEDVLERDSKLIRGRAKAAAAVDDIPDVTTVAIEVAENAYVAADAAGIITSYTKFESVSAVLVDMIVPGDFSITVQDKCAAVAVARGDAFAILSPNIDETWTTAGVGSSTGWKSTLAIASLTWQAAGYATKYKVRDQYNDRDVVVPAAGFIAGAYSLNDRIGEKWTAPAGPKRAKQSVTLDKTWTATEQDTLYDDKLNFAVKDPNFGVFVEGQKTLYASNSALSRVNVARLIVQIRRDLLSFLKEYLYDFNNRSTRTRIKTEIETYLQNVQEREGFYVDDDGTPGFAVVCDGTNNPAAVIDSNELVVDVYIKPSRVSEYIYLKSTIVDSKVNLSDVVSKSSAV